MKPVETTENGKLQICIEERITERELDKKLEEEILEGRLSGAEHCFRDSVHWYNLAMGYVNPYNISRVHAELALIEKHSQAVKAFNVNYPNDDPLFEAIRRKTLVFYGVGIGDTEMEFVDWQLRSDHNPVQVIGIDVNKDFLECFAIALKNRLIETRITGGCSSHKTIITYKGLNALFGQVTREDIKFDGSEEQGSANICVGSTIGNFYYDNDIFRIFDRTSSLGDSLILGFQTNRHLDILFEKYRRNPLFAEFVLSWVPKNERSKLDWFYDPHNGLIIAKHKSIEVFRSRKYDPERLTFQVQCHGFDLKYQDIDQEGNTCIQVYEKL
ncbi:MAG: L-histidine N(alpha)-methyltransferase [Candidatus Woesearchaeota archaeon]